MYAAHRQKYLLSITYNSKRVKTARIAMKKELVRRSCSLV